MAYFFGGLIPEPLSPDDLKLKNIALDILYSYAHEGFVVISLLLLCFSTEIIFRKPSVPDIAWLPIGEKFNFLNISSPTDIKLQIKTDFSARNFWNSLGLLENGNLFPN